MARQYDINPQWLKNKGLWRARVQKNGVRKEFTSATPGRKGKTQVVEKAEQWLEDSTTKRDPLISTAAAEWLDEVLSNVGKTAWRQYNTHIQNYIIPTIGSLRFSELTNEQQLQEVINKAFRCGVRDGRELSAAYMKDLRGTLSAFMKYARKCGYTTLHMETVQIPRRAKKSDRRTLQPDELRVLFQSSETTMRRMTVDDWYIHAYRFQVLTGLRPGELIGLQWQDIKNGTCKISRSINYHGEITPGKNCNARRTFIIPAMAREELKKQKAMLSYYKVDSPYVFPDEQGHAIKHKNYRRALLRYCAHNGIEDTCPYELRHTWYSINKALPAELVKQMGGHSEAMNTFGVYGHQVDGEAERFASMLNDTITKILE